MFGELTYFFCNLVLLCVLSPFGHFLGPFLTIFGPFFKFNILAFFTIHQEILILFIVFEKNHLFEARGHEMKCFMRCRMIRDNNVTYD